MARPRSVTLEVNTTPTQAIRVFRHLIEEAGWEWERDEGSRLVDRMMIIMPIAKVTRTFRIAVMSGEGQGLTLTAWEEVPGSSGGITKIEWVVPWTLDWTTIQRTVAGLVLAPTPLPLEMVIWSALDDRVFTSSMAKKSPRVQEVWTGHSKKWLAQ